MIRRSVALLCGFLLISFAYAQRTTLDCKLTELYISQNTKNFGMYIQVIDSLIARRGNNESYDLLFTRLKVRHIYIAHLLFNDSKSPEIRPQIAAFKEEIDYLLTVPGYESNIFPFRSTYAAYAAVRRPAVALYYLPRSFHLAKEAISTYPNSPYSWAEYGNLEYCYALFVSGNYSNAIEAFSKSIELFEKQSSSLSCNWYYINSLLFLAKSYEDNKQLIEANTVYDKILSIRPDYTAIHRWKHSL